MTGKDVAAHSEVLEREAGMPNLIETVDQLGDFSAGAAESPG